MSLLTKHYGDEGYTLIYYGDKSLKLFKDEIIFKDEKEAYKILELVRYANVHIQKPLTNDELRFIAKYPDIAKKIFTMTPLG